MGPGLVPRTLLPRLVRLARRFPVVTVTGPRQSGKTTLCRSAFPAKPYANLEAPDLRAFATSDPRGFLAQYRDGAILDEIQRVPELLSYIQETVDARPGPGRFILTGSQHFGLLATVSQSLAGRSAVLNLLPLSLAEIQLFPKPPRDLYSTMLAGGYPAVHQTSAPPAEWHSSYVATYLERDVRQVSNVGNLGAFQTFIRLCAGRSGQLMNFSALAADAGVTHNTARAWLSVLETGFLGFRLAPFHRNLGKRLTKTPKYYYYDTGLLCWLLGIRNANELQHHPLRGAVFETWVVSEVLKWRLHRGLSGDLFFYRDQGGMEVDLVLESGARLIAVEVKSGATVNADYFTGLEAFSRTAAGRPGSTPIERVVIYGGESGQRRSHATVLPWSGVAGFRWR